MARKTVIKNGGIILGFFFCLKYVEYYSFKSRKCPWSGFSLTREDMGESGVDFKKKNLVCSFL